MCFLSIVIEKINSSWNWIFKKIRIELQIFLCGIYCEKNLSGFFDSYMDRFELKCEMLSVQVAISVNYKFGHEWMNIAPIIDGSFSLP